MKVSRDLELPSKQRGDLKKARMLAWITIGWLAVDATLVYLVASSSQAMKATYLEDLLSMVPPIVFLVSIHFRNRKPNQRFPYGYHRTTTIAFLGASLALFALGAYLLYDSSMILINAEHPTIGTIKPFGEPIWTGWLMLPVLILSSGIPLVILGRMKLPLSRSLHDKTLHADAAMNKADWLTAVAASIGILGIGLGFWWADAVAACFISLDILHDGYRNIRSSVEDLMDRVPETADESQLDPLPERLAEMLKGLDWVVDARVRMREEGHVFFGEAFVVPTERMTITDHIQHALKKSYDLDWRLQDLTIQPVSELREEGDIDTEHEQERGER